MNVYRPHRYWEWYWRSGAVLALGGGLVMVVVAAIAHNAASIPLVVIGGTWLVFGLINLKQRRKVADRVQVEGGKVTFTVQGRTTTVAASEILEITRPRHDINHWGWLNVRTAHNGTIKIAARQQSLVALLLDLKVANPNLELIRI